VLSATTKPWYADISARQWKALFAAMLGWGLDGMDIMLYAFALTAIQREFGLTSAEAGGLASVTLLASGLGGLLFGYLADRIGRARALVYSILTYSIFTALTATSHSVYELILWRTLVGIGLGGEWAAGSVLVAEEWPAQHRGKAVGLVQSSWALGYIAAALLASVVLPIWNWRILFVVGIAPAVVTLWVRRNVPEPEIWSQSKTTNRTHSFQHSLAQIFRPPLVRFTLLASLLTSSLMFAYWGLFTWIPAYLASPLEKGGAGMTIVKSTPWIVVMQIGAFLGYASFGFLADRLGRKPSFVIFVLGAAASVPLYGFSSHLPAALLVLGPLVGFFGHGYFSMFGAMLAELFPSSVRGVAQGLCYNIGRSFSALAPATVGYIADRNGIGTALACMSVLFLLGAALITLLPETRGRALA
jgi:MFS family permease